MEAKTDLSRFNPQKNLTRGAGKLTEGLWYLCKVTFFLSAFPWPQSLKRSLLRSFGAEVGKGVVLKPRINIHLPWKLKIGDHSWIGEEVFILNFEPVEIGANVCVSQRAFLCTGNHNFRSKDFEYRNAPITIEPGAWIGAQVFVGPGVTIGMETVVTAGSVVTRSLAENQIYQGNPCEFIGLRWK